MNDWIEKGVDWLQQGAGRIDEANGMGVAITGMAIVFVALILITVFITVLPRVLQWIAPLGDADDEAAITAAKPVKTSGPTPEVLAAIGVALHAHKSDR